MYIRTIQPFYLWHDSVFISIQSAARFLEISLAILNDAIRSKKVA